MGAVPLCIVFLLMRMCDAFTNISTSDGSLIPPAILKTAMDFLHGCIIYIIRTNKESMDCLCVVDITVNHRYYGSMIFLCC